MTKTASTLAALAITVGAPGPARAADPYKWFDADPEWEPIETIRLIMLNGAIYKNTL